MTDVTEHEALARFIDGIKLAADAIRLVENKGGQHAQANRFAKAMTQASGSAYQLGHMQRNPDFFRVRDQLELLQKHGADMALNKMMGLEPQGTMGISPFVAISNMLLTIAEIVTRLATNKALTNQVVLEATDIRQKNLVIN